MTTAIERALYRGRRIDNGDWVEGRLWTDHNEKVFIIEIGGDPLMDDYEVDPATVGQFVGICDFYGTKLFEGDEYITMGGTIRIIYYCAEEAMFKARSHEFHKYADGEIEYYFDQALPDQRRFVEREIIRTGKTIHDGKGER